MFNKLLKQCATCFCRNIRDWIDLIKFLAICFHFTCMSHSHCNESNTSKTSNQVAIVTQHMLDNGKTNKSLIHFEHNMGLCRLKTDLVMLIEMNLQRNIWTVLHSLQFNFSCDVYLELHLIKHIYPNWVNSFFASSGVCFHVGGF